MVKTCWLNNEISIREESLESNATGLLTELPNGDDDFDFFLPIAGF